MIRSRARFQSAGPKPSGCANCSDSEFPAPAPSFASPLTSLERDAALFSVLSTAAIRSSISVPVYKLIHPCSGLDGEAVLLSESEGSPASSRPPRVGERLNCQCFQTRPVANYQGRAFQPD